MPARNETGRARRPGRLKERLPDRDEDERLRMRDEPLVQPEFPKSFSVGWKRMLDLSDVVDISVARVEETPWLGGPNNRWLNILSAEEREQRSRLKFVNDRNVFSLAHILLRHELSHHANLRPDEWVFTRQPYGKPMLAPSLMADHALHFSLSHAGSTAVCAITRVGAVGVDTESLARDIDVDAVASIALTADEQVAIAPLEAGAKLRQVLTLWTLKEAYAKAIGVGLLLPMQQYGFRLDPPHLNNRTSSPKPRESGIGCSIRACSGRTGYPWSFPDLKRFLSLSVTVIPVSQASANSPAAVLPKGLYSVGKAKNSCSVNTRERVRKRTSRPLSRENMPPRPGTTSIISCVCFQYSNCGRLM